MNYGLQLFSVRDTTEKDFEKALCEVSKLGYEFVEPAGFYGHSAEQIKEWLDKYNLKISGTHTGLNELVDDFDAVVKYHTTIGNKRFIVPGLDTSTKDALDYAVEKFNKYQPMLAEYGIDLEYHNHHREFCPNLDGIYPDYYFWNKTKINFEIDTFWAFAADRNPCDILEEFKERVQCIHLKDGLKMYDEDAKKKFKGKALGEGQAPVLNVIAKAKELGLVMVVESEGLDPTGLEEVGRCAEFLKKNG